MLIREVNLGVAAPEIFGALCDRPYSFLLDSALPAGGLGNFSFFGCDPFLVFRGCGDRIVITRGTETEIIRGDPLEELRRICRCYRTPGASELPFAGGAVGYFSYEFGLRFEKISPGPADDLQTPEMEFAFYDRVLAFEHVTGRVSIVANPPDGRDAHAIADAWERFVRDALDRGPRFHAAPPSAVVATDGPRANFTRDAYARAIARVKDYIRSGDVYQVNLSQRFEAPLPCHPFELYRRLRARSPAPFASYLNFGGRQIVSSSPERLLRVRDVRVETRPIKGTRPRGGSADEDAVLARQLVASEKDRAELLMIVDLERNDLGRVCEFGSVRVDEIYRLETHPTVFHLVANVSGALRREAGVFDCVRAMFPGGSITGAPKIRAMQIIAELEPHRRNAYTGAIGYIGGNGTCDFNLAIRTIECVGGRAYYGVGGGIVWDSDPESEYQETLDKGRAMRAALAGQ